MSIDDFHRPPPHEYYPDSFDFDRFRAAVVALDENAVIDGVFLHHPDLRDLWQLSVFLHVGLVRVGTAVRGEQLMGTLESVLMTPTATGTIQLGSVVFDLIYVPLRTALFLVAIAVGWLLAFLVLASPPNSIAIESD